MEEETYYQLFSSVNEGILEVVFTGEVTPDIIDRMQVEVSKLINEKNAKALLCDVSVVKGADRLATGYFRLKKLPLEFIRLPSAIVDRSGNRNYQEFYETVAANIGHLVKFFEDIETARAWLKSKL